MKNKRGITLIALIITIIVMLILAGVSISAIINGNIFDRANEANKLNEDAINRAEEEEANALKQNYEEFNVNDNFTISGIKMYKLVTQKKKIYDSNGNEIETEEYEKILEEIDISLSQYIEENSDSSGNPPPIYFMDPKTDRTALTYAINDVEVTDPDFNAFKVTYQREFGRQVSGEDYKVNDIIDADDEDGNMIRTNLIKVDGITKDKLKGLKVAIRDSKDNDLYSLEFEYNDKRINDSTTAENEKAETIYIPTGVSTYFGSEVPTEKFTEIKFDYQIKNENDVYFSPKTSITNKYTYEQPTTKGVTVKSRFATIYEESDTYIALNPARYSSIQPDEDGNDYDQLTLYLVQEKDTDNSKTMYLDDYEVEFYNPVTQLEIITENLPSEIISEKEIKYSAKNDLGSNADLDKVEWKIKSTKVKDETIPNSKIYSFSIDDNKKIKVNGKSENLSEFEIEITAYDRNDHKTQTKTIAIINDTFRVYAFDSSGKIINGKEEETDEVGNGETFALLDDAYDCAVRHKNKGYSVTIEQLGNFVQDSDFEIGIDLTFDLNKKTLTFADYKRVTIANGVTFNLISSNDTGNAGNINFNHPTTFVADTVAKKASQEDFLSNPKYKKFESLDAYLKANGHKVYWFNKLIYWDQYLADRLDAYMEYMHSFNQLAYNVKYSESFSGIINNGTFNFESGKVVVNTDEQVMAMGLIGGEVVLNIADTFLEFLNEIGIKTTDLSQLLLTYAQIENTGVGIENHGILNLGTDKRRRNF